MKRFVIVASLALLLAGPSRAHAAVIYEEVTKLDDLPIDAPYPVLALALGTNSVLGGTSFNSDAVDSFAVSVPDGLQLASITYTFTSAAFIRGGGSLTQAVSGLSLVSGDGTAPQPGSSLDVQNLDMIPGLCSVFVMTCGPSSPSAATVTLFEDALPLGAGIYSVEQRALTVNSPELINWTSRYRIDLVVIPEPGALLLGGAAIASLAAGWVRSLATRDSTPQLGRRGGPRRWRS
jgi:hypothetical protein